MRGPLSRLAAILGLLMMVPIGYLVIIGELTVVDASVRAAVTLAAVIVVRRLGRFGVGVLADSMERMSLVAPQRRSADRPPAE
jgi:hypothetical protein